MFTVYLAYFVHKRGTYEYICSCQGPAVNVAGHIVLHSECCDICVVRKLRGGTARAVFRIW
jgi:hypothetical protein